MTEARFETPIATDLHTLSNMIRELRKEMMFRFIMSYSLILALIGVILWYFVSFTQNYGWTISWFWLLTGGLAAIMRFFVYECFLCLVLVLMIKSQKCRSRGMALGKQRKHSIACEEA